MKQFAVNILLLLGCSFAMAQEVIISKNNTDPTLHVLSASTSQTSAPLTSTLHNGSGINLGLSAAIWGDGGSGASGISGTSYGGAGVWARSNISMGLLASSQSSYGAYISNYSATGVQPALYVSSVANAYAAQIMGNQESNKRALQTDGQLKFTGINEQNGAILKGDAQGNATWGKNMMAAAYGQINFDGTIIKGSGNFLAAWDAVNKEYTIIFTNEGTAMNIPVITEVSNGGTAATHPATVHIINSNQFKVKKRMQSTAEGYQFSFFFVVF